MSLRFRGLILGEQSQVSLLVYTPGERGCQQGDVVRHLFNIGVGFAGDANQSIEYVAFCVQPAADVELALQVTVAAGL
ncbi:hypothetical protein ULF88_22020 [Halopseudomonas pachastrellae]|nr:hypothetical protein [Halopseudomonas pachastrellae]